MSLPLEYYIDDGFLCSLREAYRYSDLSWVDKCFDEIKKIVKDMSYDELSFEDDLDCPIDLNEIFKGHCIIEIGTEYHGTGKGYNCIIEGLPDKSTKLPTIVVANTFLKHFKNSKDIASYDRMRTAFYHTLVHELTHKDQEEGDVNSKAPAIKDTDSPMEYTGNYSEIDGHARQVADYFERSGIKNPLTQIHNRDFISNIKDEKIKRILFTYLKQKHPVWKKFLREIYDYLHKQ